MRKEWLRVTGLTNANVEEVTRHPDKTEVIERHGLFLQFFVRKSMKTTPPSTVLVVAEQMPNSSVDLLAFFRVYDGFVANLDAVSPTELLRLIADRFCLDVRISGTVRKLFLDEAVQLPRPDDLKVTVAGPAKSVPNQRLIGIQMVRVSDDGLMADCACVLAVDTYAYETYLHQARTGSG